jgi:hypothetical protein
VVEVLSSMRLKWWQRALLNATVNAGLAFFTMLGSSSLLLPGTEFQKILASLVAGAIFAGATFFSTLKKCLKLDEEEPPKKEHHEPREGIKVGNMGSKPIIIELPEHKKNKISKCIDDCSNPLLII